MIDWSKRIKQDVDIALHLQDEAAAALAVSRPQKCMPFRVEETQIGDAESPSSESLKLALREIASMNWQPAASAEAANRMREIASDALSPPGRNGA